MTDCELQPCGKGYCCTVCGWSFSRIVRRNCPGPGGSESRQSAGRIEQAPARVLTDLGEKLLQVAPGDAAAALAKYSGAAALAHAWETLTGQPCGCTERQTWLNNAWQGFVRQHFSEKQ